jgi:hypothetical protein
VCVCVCVCVWMCISEGERVDVKLMRLKWSFNTPHQGREEEKKTN